MKTLGLLTSLAVTAAGATLQAGVVINEIFYNAPDGVANLQWIELHNPDDKGVDLSGWRLGKGVAFTFPPNSSIAAGGYAVVCRDAKLFSEFYATPVAGAFSTSLKHSGATIELLDAAGKRVDQVKYSNKAPWPISPDGQSSSLERITPSADGSLPANWTASPLPTDERTPAGSPGQRNHAFSANLPPVITNARFSPDQPGPGDTVAVQASVSDPDGIREVELRYQLAMPGRVTEEKSVVMKSDGGTFKGEIPPQVSGSLVRFRVRAVDSQRTERFYPAATDLRPAISYYVQSNPDTARISLAHVINTDRRDVAEAERYRQRSRRGGNDPFGNPKRREVNELLESGTDLGGPWLELTVEQTPDYDTYRALRKVFAAKEAERQRLYEESMSSVDFEATAAQLPARIAAFQESFLAAVRTALPAEKAEAFGKWYLEQNKPAERSPARFLKDFMRIEGGWLALNTQFELAEPQFQSIRPVFKTALAGRTAQLPTFEKLMRGEGDFVDLQNALGKVEKQLNEDRKGALSYRQSRYFDQWQRDHGSFIRPRLTETRPLPPRGRSAFIVVDAQTKKAEVFDFVNIAERSAGYKVRLHKDHTLRGMNTVDVIFEYNDRFVMAEPLAFDFYRRVGAPASETDFVRLSLDGQTIGYHLLFEQVNRSFLRRNKINADGDLYKLIWYGRSIETQHEKQTNPETGHGALLELIAQLNSTKGAEQWSVIQKNFDVSEVIAYFAVNMCLSHWDGFFNNYFAYHDKTGAGLWRMFPWDQDKTWGFHDSIPAGEIFYDMPITFGMEGDRPPGGGPPRFNPGSWWRPGGFFSKPLLANTEFRKRFLARTREMLEKEYTPEVMFPVIDGLAAKLRPEIPIRAAAIQEDPAEAMKRFEANVASLKEHLVKRRDFLLKETEIKAIASTK